MEDVTTELKHFSTLWVANIVPDLEISPFYMSFSPLFLFSPLSPEKVLFQITRSFNMLVI